MDNHEWTDAEGVRCRATRSQGVEEYVSNRCGLLGWETLAGSQAAGDEIVRLASKNASFQPLLRRSLETLRRIGEGQDNLAVEIERELKREG
jgi:hypothetical protein